MQNAAFEALELDWAYVPLPVSHDQLERAVTGLRGLGFAGANVTIPHKTAVVGLCDQLTPVAERAGSVNTLVFSEQDTLGSSTDGFAITSAVSCAGEHALLLGAGGAAQAVATALVDARVTSLTVASRRQEPAHALANRITGLGTPATVQAAERWPPESDEATLVVNATPLKDDVPIRLHPALKIVDLAYRRDGSATMLVEQARRLGSRVVVDGFEVLARQGAASFECWTGIEAPIDIMRKALQADTG